MIKKAPINSRLLALSILDDTIKNKQFINIALNNKLKSYQQLSKQERAFITRLVEGTLENMIYIDYVIDNFSKTKTSKMKITILNIIRMTVYQIKNMDSVPDSAACNEAVKLAKKRGFYKLSGFVNGVSRNIARNINNIPLPDKNKDKVKYLSIKYSFPTWIIILWLKQYDYKTVEELCEASNKVAKTSIRCNTTVITPAELKKELEDEGIVVEKSDYIPYALKISDYNYLEDIISFKKGLFQVQDESSMLVGFVLSPKLDTNEIPLLKKPEKYLILDVCSAPGGKGTHLAELFNGIGQVISRDLTERKINIINENIERLNLNNIETQVHDALELDKSLIEKADIVIADLPCSGLGIIRRKPDIKYKLDKNQLNELIDLQKLILSVINQYVKPGGLLIYSTCTINKNENQNNVEWFINNYPFELEDISKYLPNKIKVTNNESFIQLLPNTHNTDGFFIARLKKQ